MYELSCRMQPSAVYSSLRLEALVEDAFKNLNEGGAEASTAGGSRGQNGAVVVLDDRWRHHALHPLARLERIHEQVRLSEHAVQMDVEVRKVVAGAEAETRRQNAGVAA